MERFQKLSPKDVLHAQHLLLEMLAYEEMQNTTTSNNRERTPPQVLEETDPIYGVLAKPVNVHWVPVQDRGKRSSLPRPAENIDLSSTNVGECDVRTNQGQGPRGSTTIQSSARGGTVAGRRLQSISTLTHDVSSIQVQATAISSVPININVGTALVQAEASKARAD